ncbi:MAG: threonylcarbamoyl-AMP synthase [Candidatus Omnitrophota bacterium]|nr:MAG: threonylcarbamoyl-AMP synthase [Candidatus Omnitrophota bacterium]
MIKKISIDPDNVDYSLVRKAANAIRDGSIVALPTETVYGLAAFAENQKAVERLYEIKQRPRAKPFAYVVDDSSTAIERYFAPLTPFGHRLMEKFWPGPITIIYHSQKDEKIGVRVPSHAVTQEVLKMVRAGVYLPSANITGKPEATSAQDVETAFDGKIDLIVDGGESFYGQPSTVIDLTYHPFNVLREGVISENEIIEVFIRKRVLFVCTGNTCRSPMAEALLKKYLTEAKPYLIDRYDISSCGISPFEGTPPAANVVSILEQQEGLDVRGLSSRKIDRQAIMSSDLIFTMEDAQNDYILRFEPTVEGRIFTLKKFLPPELEKDIPDPIGKNYDVYREVYQLIRKAVLELKEWL